MRFLGFITAVILAVPPCVAGAADDAAPPGAPPRPARRAYQIPPKRPATSPVESFRRLLAMPEAERAQFLTNYPASKRDQILAKVEEYAMLPGEFRELRLRATELQWYLEPLLRAPNDSRAVLMEAVPEAYRDLIAARLEEWDLWPPDLKAEVLEYRSTMARFVARDARGNPVVKSHPIAEDLPARDRFGLERKLARWQGLPATQQQQMFAGFQRYFEFNEAEKQRILNSLSEPERQGVEKALDPIEQWPRPQQEQYLAAFRRFAGMSPAERDRFMRNAERWQKMSAEERQAWRDLVQQLADTPPLPPDVVPPGGQPAGSGSLAPGRTNPTASPLR